jgi:pimeloyl-ACP methyl ester carboxylesterase
MTTFGLVHGAWHGAWCWDLLVPELEARGHRGIPIDLPADDPDAGLEDYASIVTDALDGIGGDELVIVGHSLGGLTAALVAGRRPTRALVYLCAFVPVPGQSLAVIAPHALVPGFGLAQISHDDGSSSWPTDAAVETFFHDCEPQVAAWAASKLRRQGWRIGGDRFPLDQLPEPATYVLCTEERAISPAWSRARAEAVGAAVVELPGGHSPFLSRPAALAEVLSAV